MYEKIIEEITNATAILDWEYNPEVIKEVVKERIGTIKGQLEIICILLDVIEKMERKD